VAILHDRADRPVTGVIVEVQRQVDSDKLLTWPVYVATLRAKLDCAAVLLVVAPDPEVATWARRLIELGHPGFRLAPIVIGFEDVPWVRDRTAALRLPELAVLSVMAHPELEIAEVAIDAIAQLPPGPIAQSRANASLAHCATRPSISSRRSRSGRMRMVGRACVDVVPTHARAHSWQPVEGTPASLVPPQATSEQLGGAETPLECPGRDLVSSCDQRTATARRSDVVQARRRRERHSDRQQSPGGEPR